MARRLASLLLLAALGASRAGGEGAARAQPSNEELLAQFGRGAEEGVRAAGGTPTARPPLPTDAAALRQLLDADAGNREAWRALGFVYQARGMADATARDTRTRSRARAQASAQAGGGSEAEAEAAHAFGRAAELGDSQAQARALLAPPPPRRSSSRARDRDQEELGFLHAPRDPAAALAYWYFAASGNATGAQMALGYRHLHGLGVPRSCAAAALYYAPAAAATLGPPPPAAAGDGRALLAHLPGAPPAVDKLRLDSETGARLAARAREREMVAYYRYSADQGNSDAAAAMGQLLTAGGRGVARDLAAAARYLQRASERGDAEASAQLGLLLASGAGVGADPPRALALLRPASEAGLPAGQYGMGLLLLTGTGVARDAAAALAQLGKAAEAGHGDAHTALGAIYALGLAGVAQDRRRAFLHLLAAAGGGGGALASYLLALLQLHAAPPPAEALQTAWLPAPLQSAAAGDGVPGGCRAAVALLKAVAERGEAARVLERAAAAHARGDAAAALQLYRRGAAMGIEVAQANAAWLLASVPGPAAAAERLAWLRRSAEQGHTASLVRLGDAHYYGRGTRVDSAAAAAAYGRAGELRSAQALFNLGAMHQFGLGLPADTHLAKRYYDMAAEAEAEAALAVKLALLALRAQEAARPLLRRHPAIAAALMGRLRPLLGPVAGAGAGAGAEAKEAAAAEPAEQRLSWMSTVDVEGITLGLLCTALALVVGRIWAGHARAGEEDAAAAEAEGEHAVWPGGD